MKFYFAPMEGLTRYIYRNAYHTFFGGKIDKYFSPFINATMSDSFKSRELVDVLPEHNKEIYLVPQIMTNRAREFTHTAGMLKELGYEEVNLNLGCPSKTVVAKGRGSGFLAMPKELDAFLEEIFENRVTDISIKTRIGKDEPEEFYELIEIYNKYPLKELIIHPRVQSDFYNNKPNLDIFSEALNLSKNPICYNGDIHTAAAYWELADRFPKVEAVMLGRGLLFNPMLIQDIMSNPKGQDVTDCFGKGERVDRRRLREFHDTIYADYKEILSGDTNVLFKMKEFWHYFIHMFSNHEKYIKKIKKSQKAYEYEAVVNRIFEELELR
ncbi:tRNA dihydrouridine synthase [Konateibacter massiliensis]|uniref:tRNA dihydrouridine synthase n=1 Tax=Konateibacter massiliensis TaxID=2002841 RepID=UPI000C15E829|nr:tRNA-dihydrouridine synthase family protein [Konateibacter massiliensis]